LAIAFADSASAGWLERLIGVFAVSLPLLLITLFIPGAFGGGDIKLMAVCGFALGWRLALLAAFIGILTGGIYGVYLLAAKKKERKEHFAFAPFLSLGCAVSLLFGESILSWYLSLF
ncbi:MAG: A24 family peptidase, partial [Oscillospiraceae bacterium]|nr:A24 family peptidase [Oscillospiraceae bacterium]